MKDKPDPDLMDEARQLLETGNVQEALVLAMDLLRRELDQVRDALDAIREHLPASAEQGEITADNCGPDFAWPDPVSLLLH